MNNEFKKELWDAWDKVGNLLITLLTIAFLFLTNRSDSVNLYLSQRSEIHSHNQACEKVLSELKERVISLERKMWNHVEDK